MVVYILLGLIGLPIFANFVGGPGAVFVPSFGFVLSFPFAALFIASTVNDEMAFGRNIMVLIIATFIIYLIGTPYLYLILNVYMKKSMSLPVIFTATILPCLPGDTLKIFVAHFVGKKVRKAIK